MAKVPNIKVEPPGPEAKKIVAKDTEYIVKATKTAPLVFKRAEGAVIDACLLVGAREITLLASDGRA